MKMHSQKFKDPLISQAQPVTILGPLIEESLKLALQRPNRDHIIDRFMAGQPRIAVVHGSGDHPGSIGCRDLVRRLVRQLWADGALPVEVSEAVPCEELSRGLPGTHYAFLGRNVCAANLGTLMEAHGYDAALILGSCDKMLVGSLRALIETDLGRQRKKSRPVYAAFLPSVVSPEVRLEEEGRRRFEDSCQKMPEHERGELFSLLGRPIDADLYESIKASLDRAFHQRTILESEKDELERLVARRALAPGAHRASSEASIVTRMMVSSFGLVPRQLDLSLTPPSDQRLAQVVSRLLQGIERRERRIGVAQLVKSNLQNSLSVWVSMGGDPTWLLHLSYLAHALGVRLSPTLIDRRLSKVPQLVSFGGEEGGLSAGVAAEHDAGKNSGIDTLMRTLSEKRFIDDRASTIEESWIHRISDARSANGHYFHSTITPSSHASGLFRVRGNLCTSGLLRLGRGLVLEDYDRKVYLADFFLGQEELSEAMAAPGGVFERVRKKLTQSDLHQTWSINWNTPGTELGVSGWDKKRLWEYLLEQNLLRLVLFVAGEGPCASGMPQVRYPASVDRDQLQRTCILATDGRSVFSRQGTSIVHMVPEAMDHGALAAVRTGDWVYLNSRKGEFHLVKAARNEAGFRVLSDRELSRRDELRKRMQELERRRSGFLPSVRSVLDSVTSATEGVSPASV